jgi:hypothetical protein
MQITCHRVRLHGCDGAAEPTQDVQGVAVKRGHLPTFGPSSKPLYHAVTGMVGPSSSRRWPWLLLGGALLVAILLGQWLASEQRPAASPTAGIGSAPGQTAPVGSLPPPSPTPRLIFYRGDPFGPVKVEPGGSYTVRLGHLEEGTLVRAVVSVAFNNRLSNVTGNPDIDVTVNGPAGSVTASPRAGNGTQVAFQAPTDGEYSIVLGNTYSRVNAKQVSLQFLQP